MAASSLYNSSLSPSRSDNNTIVTIDLTNHPPNSKLGMLLAPSSLPTSSNVTLVAGWEHGTNQQLGPIQRSGMVRLGDRLVRINGRDVTDWTFREVMDALKEMLTSLEMKQQRKNKKKLKTLGFAPSGTEEWSRGVIVGGEEFNSTSALFGLFQSQESKMSPHVISKRLYSFVSFVGRWRVVVEEPTTTTTAASQTATTMKSDVVPTKEEGTKKEQLLQQDQQQRQVSENSTDLLEEQLTKEPSMKFHNGDGPIIDTLNDENDKINPHDGKEQSPNQAAPTTTAAAATTTTTTEEAATQPPSIFSPEAEAEWHKEITQFQQQQQQQQQQQNTRLQTKKPIVQYEIQCHLLLRDPNSFKSNNKSSSSSNANKNSNTNVHHHSWSVWKRYSEFQTLDSELRNTFGWQMDATDDGRGISFPGSHGLESWWYGIRNGGGYLTSLLGGSYGVDVDVDVDGRVEEDETDKKNKKDNKTDKGGGGGGSSGIFGFFSNNTTNEAVTSTTNGNTDDDSNNNASTSSTTTTTTTCPYPKPFIEKRQKELGSYWINLSRVEDIFEFSDIHSHRFGTLMASFLEVDQVLLTRRNTNSRASAAAAVPFSAGAAASSGSSLQQQRYHHLHHHAPISPSRLTAVVPVIHENETELFSFGARKSEQWQSPLTTSREFSDDVSMLSDGTGANAYLTSLQNNHNSPVHAHAANRRRLLVDNVPAHFTSNHPLPLIATENRSVSSKSTRRVGGRGASRGTKPAFQRQFIE